jgi:hypothetical protein
MRDRALDEGVRELYREDPSNFTAARDRLVAAARERGDEELAQEVRKLRRPTAAAWAVNILSVRETERIDALIALGQRLRSAHRDMRRDELRRLDRERSEVLRDLTAEAARLAGESGRPLGDQARQQVERTLHAALSDTGCAQEVRAATLAKPLEYSGFGLDEASAATLRAAPDTKPAGLDTKPAGRGKSARPGRREGAAPEITGRRRKQAEASLGAARAELDRAVNELRDASERLDHVEQDQRAVEERRARLEHELAQSERDLRDSGRKSEQARRRWERARDKHEEIERRVRERERRLSGDGFGEA